MLQYYANVRSTTPDSLDLPSFIELTRHDLVVQRINAYRAGDAEVKKRLPAITFMGTTTSGKRRAADMVPTGLVMLDVDHVHEGKMQALIEHVMELKQENDIVLIHITPSGNGLRIVAMMPAEAMTYSLEEYTIALVNWQKALASALNLADYGDVDECIKDLSRLSFVPLFEDVKYINGEKLFNPRLYINEQPTETPVEPSGTDGTQQQNDGMDASDDRDSLRSDATAGCSSSPTDEAGAAADGQTSAEEEDYSSFLYGQTPVVEIVRAYMADKGEPADGQRHAFYNNLVLNFRNLCNNDPVILAHVLPRFEESYEKRLSQCKSICSRNSTVKLPKPFWGWLKDNKFYVDTWRGETSAEEDEEPEDPYQAEHDLIKRMPTLPPVFREFVNAAPLEFKIPTLFALCPVMGTVATYLQAEYYDGETHTPSFFTVIYAPPGSGKSFVNRFVQLDLDRQSETNLLSKLLERDFVTEQRMNLYNEFAKAKGANDKGHAVPKVSKRICETITSQADLLPAMKDNQGMHMFMFAPEIDTLIKGMKSGGGGDKNDIFRTAWDNGMYGQSYRSANSFRGKVAMYLNLLVSGTPAQCTKMFRDPENGLVSRCLFTDLGQQDFAKYQPWKKLSEQALTTIDNWRRRCDAETYRSSLDFDLTKVTEYEDEEKFDAEVPWEYRFNGRTTIDLSYINTALLAWLEDERKRAERDGDYARDAFRKRAAGNAFRVALLCYSCWKKVTKREQKIILDFCLWFADLALMKYLKRWGKEMNKVQAEYQNNAAPARKTTILGTLFDSLPKTFTRGDLRIQKNKFGCATAERKIASIWLNAGLTKLIAKNQWEKL